VRENEGVLKEGGERHGGPRSEIPEGAAFKNSIWKQPKKNDGITTVNKKEIGNIHAATGC